jgi:hypothetical protein
MIPVEPDPDNAGEGRIRDDFKTLSPVYGERVFYDKKGEQTS